MAIDLTGITNENEFYTHHYLAAILEGDLKPLFEAWSRLENAPWDGMRGLARPFQAIQRESYATERQALRLKFFADLFAVLGYSFTPDTVEFEDGTVLPLAGQITRANGQPELWALAALGEAALDGDEDDPLTSQEEILTKQVFAAAEPPRWVLLYGTCTNCGANFERMLPVWIPDTNHTVKKKDGTEKRLGSHDCPSCGGHNSLTILGSRAASLTSVIIAQLFSSTFNEDKKLLAFSDSVQDASHRSGFFAARTYTFNLRSAIQKTIRSAAGPVPFETLTARFLEDWRQRLKPELFLATFLPPDMNWLEDYEALRTNGKLPDSSDLMSLLDRRLAWEIWSEYTFDCRIGRTLEKTGSSTLEVKPELWQKALVKLLQRLREQIGALRELDHVILSGFLVGLVQNLKNRGAVDENDLAPYIEGLGNTWLLGKQNGRAVWRPNFSRASRAPVFLTSRGGERFQTLIRQPNNPTPTWYEDWLEKSFYAVDPTVANSTQAIYEVVLGGLRETGLIFERDARGARVWGLAPAAFQVTSDVIQFRCKYCSFAVSVGATDSATFDGNRCMRYGCDGHFERSPAADDYYRRLYETGDVRRIFSAEHTRRLFVCVAAVLFTTSCSRDPKPGTPEAAAAGERFMRSMSDTLARSKAFTFETSERLDVIASSGEKRALHFTRKVTVRRPNAIFFELQRKGGSALEVAAYYDGRTLTLSERPEGAWAQTTVPGTLDEMLDDVARRFSLPVPIGDVVYSSP